MCGKWEESASERSLENWERWIKIRKEGDEALGKATGRKPGCLLMNRDSVWQLRRQKEVFLDAQKIKEYQCKCGETGCPLFWKTTMPLRPCGKNLLAEAYFAPLKLTHENKRLSNLVEAEYIGLPECLNHNEEILGAKCLESSVERWNKSPYVSQKRAELARQIDELQGHVPEVDGLVIVGKSLNKPKKVEVKYEIPEIVISEVSINEDTVDETEPTLQIGPCLLRGRDEEEVTCNVEFTPVLVPQTHARDVLIVNRGSIAIEYFWKKEPEELSFLPLRYTRNVLSRFFFNKCDGILLPGQSFIQRFWFKSRTPGFFREVWDLQTIPQLPNIKFILEAVASKNPTEENNHILMIEKYLDKCIKRTVAHEITQSSLHQVVATSEENTNQYSSKFFEKEIFNNINTNLYYDEDTVVEVKELYSRFFPGKWNLSMADLCDMLVEKIKDEDETIKTEVMNTFTMLFRRLQKKSLLTEIDENDWEMLKYDLCYMLLCTAIGQMEKCLRYDCWGIPLPNGPPGPKGEYSGEAFDTSKKRKNSSLNQVNYNNANYDNGNTTEEEENRLEEEESKPHELSSLHPWGEDEIEKFTFNIGLKIEFDGPQETDLPSRRWLEKFNTKEDHLRESIYKRETKSFKSGKDAKKIEKGLSEKMKDLKGIKTKEDLILQSAISENLSIEKEQPEAAKSEVVKFHQAFIIMHWRNILERTLDNIAEVVDLTNSFRGVPAKFNPHLSERLHHSCSKHPLKDNSEIYLL